MKKRIPPLLATLIGSAIYSQHGIAADLASQCMLGVPAYDRPLMTGDTDQQPVTINSADASGNYPDDAVFSGNVDVRQGNARLIADKAQVHQKMLPNNPVPIRTVDAQGNVRYDNNQVILNGSKAWSNLNTKDTNVWKGDYQLVGRQGRGNADLMKQRDQNRYTILDNGSFTSCLPGQNTWSVVGTTVIQDRKEQVAEIWNARFKLGPVPVFYSPYMQFPIGNKRRSGFLIPPEIAFSGKTGFQLAVPFYWNIAPEMDATITPRYMKKRNAVMWETEYRYLSFAGNGTMALNYLDSDKRYKQDYPGETPRSKRWLYYWNHSGVVAQVWRFNIDYTKVSDRHFFEDFSSKYGSSTDGYATQKFSLGYANQNFDATLSAKQFQVLTDVTSANSYKALPQLDVNYYYNNLGPFDARIYGQAVRFENVSPNRPQATRLHLEPTLDLPIANNWASLDTEIKLLTTHYQQSNLGQYRQWTLDNSSGNQAAIDQANGLKGSVSRTIPQFKIDSKLVFERDMDWSQGYTQTMEPRVQYLYRPYRDQRDINIYDSALLQSDFSGLFRERNFGGLDRISSANQVTTGVTTRVFDDASVERFNASIGQVYYFTPSRNGDDGNNFKGKKNTGSILWAGDTYWRITDQWGLRGGLQYDTRLSNIATGNGTLEYRQDIDRLVQFGYRYASAEYISAALPNSSSAAKQYQDGISQIGMTASWSIANRWSVVGAYYYDTHTSKPAEQMVGVQYNSCCYSIGFLVQRKLNGWKNGKGDYDVSWGPAIQIRGLNSNYSLGSQQMLRSGMIPYQPSM